MGEASKSEKNCEIQNPLKFLKNEFHGRLFIQVFKSMSFFDHEHSSVFEAQPDLRQT